MHCLHCLRKRVERKSRVRFRCVTRVKSQLPGTFPSKSSFQPKKKVELLWVGGHENGLRQNEREFLAVLQDNTSPKQDDNPYEQFSKNPSLIILGIDFGTDCRCILVHVPEVYVNKKEIERLSVKAHGFRIFFLYSMTLAMFSYD